MTNLIPFFESIPLGTKTRGAAIPGRSLFLFCGRKVEPHYSPETAAALLDKSPETVRGWIKDRRIRKVKVGCAKSASVLIPESELRRLLQS
jgi:excisionase family DNA binding protein